MAGLTLIWSMCWSLSLFLFICSICSFNGDGEWAGRVIFMIHDMI
jgi:hypothetical protein